MCVKQHSLVAIFGFFYKNITLSVVSKPSPVLGNMVIESSINPGYWEDGNVGVISDSIGYGLVQWTPASELIDFAKQYGLSSDSITVQLMCIMWQCRRQTNNNWYQSQNKNRSNYYMSFDSFMKTTSTDFEYLARVVQYSYLRGGYGTESLRAYNANQFYAFFTKGTTPKLKDPKGNIIR